MTEFLAVFRSRSQAIDCANKLKSFNVPAGLINTPKQANIGCGLSVKIPVNYMKKAKAIIAHSAYSAFYGYLKFDFK